MTDDLMTRLKSMFRGELKYLPPMPWGIVVTSANGYAFELEVEKSGESKVRWEPQNLTGVVTCPVDVRIFGVGEAGETFSKRIILTDGGDCPSEKELQNVCA